MDTIPWMQVDRAMAAIRESIVHSKCVL